jgi:hypothetical protein
VLVELGAQGGEASQWSDAAARVPSIHTDKRNAGPTAQGLNKRGEPRPTRSFILEGVHPGKERSFSGAETLHVNLGAFGQTRPPGLQLQFHPTCTVEKPDQQLTIADTLYRYRRPPRFKGSPRKPY